MPILHTSVCVRSRVRVCTCIDFWSCVAVFSQVVAVLYRRDSEEARENINNNPFSAENSGVFTGLYLLNHFLNVFSACPGQRVWGSVPRSAYTSQRIQVSDLPSARTV